jgi:hypothetical protein
MGNSPSAIRGSLRGARGTGDAPASSAPRAAAKARGAVGEAKWAVWGKAEVGRGSRRVQLSGLGKAHMQ